MRPTYFKILKQQHPLMYRMCCCIFVIYLFLNIIRIEIPPFFLSMMYSVPIENNDTQVVYDFIYNQERQWNAPSYHQHHQRCMYYYTILFYDQCISQSPPQAADGVKLKERFSQHLQLGPYLDKVYASSEDIAAYPAWLADYMSSVIHEK